VGAKAYVGVLEGPNEMLDIDGGAVAIGARVRYVFSGGLPIALLGEAYFATWQCNKLNCLFKLRSTLSCVVSGHTR
jgi:hypothetical protein